MIRVIVPGRRGGASSELRARAWEQRREAHEKASRGECEGMGHDPQCDTCECAWYCREARHMPNLFLY